MWGAGGRQQEQRQVSSLYSQLLLDTLQSEIGDDGCKGGHLLGVVRSSCCILGTVYCLASSEVGTNRGMEQLPSN